MEVAPIDAFRRDPKRFWDFYRPRFSMLGDKRPNPAHEALAELERRGLLDAVITQNIDRLHRAAGTREPDRGPRVDRDLELHHLRRQLRARRGRGAVRRPTGSPSATAARAWSSPTSSCSARCCPWRRSSGRRELAAGADLMLCVGSSLEVYPVAGLPELTLANGGRVAIVTKGPTPLTARPRSSSTATWPRSCSPSSRRSTRPRTASGGPARSPGRGALASASTSAGPGGPRRPRFAGAPRRTPRSDASPRRRSPRRHRAGSARPASRPRELERRLAGAPGVEVAAGAHDRSSRRRPTRGRRAPPPPAPPAAGPRSRDGSAVAVPDR